MWVCLEKSPFFGLLCHQLFVPRATASAASDVVAYTARDRQKYLGPFIACEP